VESDPEVQWDDIEKSIKNKKEILKEPRLTNQRHSEIVTEIEKLYAEALRIDN
jgi:hypothetical protein